MGRWIAGEGTQPAQGTPLDALVGDRSEDLPTQRAILEYQRHKNEVANEQLLTTIRNALGHGIPKLMYWETFAIFVLVIVASIRAPEFNNKTDTAGGWGFVIDPVTLRVLAAATLLQVAALVGIIVTSLYPKGGKAGTTAPQADAKASAEEPLPRGIKSFLDDELQKQDEGAEGQDVAGADEEPYGAACGVSEDKAGPDANEAKPADSPRPEQTP